MPQPAEKPPLLESHPRAYEVLRVGGLFMSGTSPCVSKGCSMCCRETVMPITAVEASRLTRRTGMAEDQFCSKDENGIRRLLNNQDTRACVFLATSSDLPSAPGICSVYDSRPLGCKTYPVILNEEDLAILDDLCPYTESFDEPGEDDAHILLNLEEKLKR